MYNNSTMSNNCGCNCNYNNNYKTLPRNCNINCGCDEIALQALNNMARYLSEVNDTREVFEMYKATLNETNVLYKELGRVDVLYSRFDKAIQQATQGNNDYERALSQIIKAYDCCLVNLGQISPECQSYIDSAKKIQSEILNINGQIVVKLRELENAAIVSGESNGGIAVSVFGFSEPLSLSSDSKEEEIGYQEESYAMKIDGYNCCKNNTHVCGSCSCYDKSNPLCQCDEIMRQSQEKRMQGEREGIYSNEQQKILQVQTKILSDSLNKGQESSNNVYKIMDEIIKLQISLTNRIKEGIDSARKGYTCCSNIDSECTPKLTYSYTNNYKYNYSYNPCNTCKEDCSVDCNEFIREADRLIELGSALLNKATELYASLKVEIDSRIEIESESLQLYHEAIAGIEKSFEDFNKVTKNIYENVLCKLDEAYLCCTRQY